MQRKRHTSFLTVVTCCLWVAPLALTAACGGDDTDSSDAAHDADHSADHNADHNADHGGMHNADHLSKMVGPDSGATCPDDSTLTYANFGKDFFSKYCLRCHSSKVKGDARMGAPDDHNFDTLAEIDLLHMHIDELAAAGPDSTNTAMPKTDPKPTTDERKKLGEWLACGSPE